MASSSATAFAPATVGNVGVGFDVLGHAFNPLGDRVRAARRGQPGVQIVAINGAELPLEAAANTAGRAVQSLIASLALPWGVELSIDKGIPLGSGLGGSAASAVAAVVAVNALLDQPRPLLELLPHAVAGEAVASGSPHADNVAPSLFGGLVLTLGLDPPRIQKIPVPPPLRCVLVHPHMFLSTRAARDLLRPTVSLADHVRQSALLAGFIAGCHTGDLELIRACLRDLIVEPQRVGLIPGFDAAKHAALAQGALGCSISGAGPSLFAWCEEPAAQPVGDAMAAAIRAQGLACDTWIAPVGGEGARVLPGA